jgi:hypothetical protein
LLSARAGGEAGLDDRVDQQQALVSRARSTNKDLNQKIRIEPVILNGPLL